MHRERRGRISTSGKPREATSHVDDSELPALDIFILLQHFEDSFRVRAFLDRSVNEPLVLTGSIHARLRRGDTHARHDDRLNVHEPLGREG